MTKPHEEALDLIKTTLRIEISGGFDGLQDELCAWKTSNSWTRILPLID